MNILPFFSGAIRILATSLRHCLQNDWTLIQVMAHWWFPCHPTLLANWVSSQPWPWAHSSLACTASPVNEGWNLDYDKISYHNFQGIWRYFFPPTDLILVELCFILVIVGSALSQCLWIKFTYLEPLPDCWLFTNSDCWYMVLAIKNNKPGTNPQSAGTVNIT